MDFKSSGSGNDENGDLADINIVPLVDVMLVLLIIFMVTAPLSIGGIKVELPASKAKSMTIDEDRVVLSVTQSGDYYIEKMQVSPAALQERLKAIFEFRQKKELYIRADHGVVYGSVVDAMTAAKQAGIQKLSMLTQAPKGKKG